MSWWDSAYRAGRVNWDPGLYDGHLSWLLATYAIAPCAVVDLGCGTGKSVVWLARQGFEATGVDLSPTAIELARRNARSAGVRCRFLHGSYPADFTDAELAPRAFGLVVERGFLQHFGESGALDAILERTRRIMRPDALFYSLITAREGTSGLWGPRRWREDEIRRAVAKYFRVEEMRLSVFTAGEKGSIPAWVTIMRPLAE